MSHMFLTKNKTIYDKKDQLINAPMYTQNMVNNDY